MKSVGGTPSPDDVIREALLAELYFECEEVLKAWSALVHMVSSGDVALAHGGTEEVVNRWQCADRLLTHAVRVYRILDPVLGQGTPTSLAHRQRVASALGVKLQLNETQRAALRKARNMVEHADEYLPEFVLANPGKALGPVSVGPEADKGAPRNYIALRALNTLDWICSVNGVAVNLKEVVDASRQVRFYLPPPGVSPKFVPKI